MVRCDLLLIVPGLRPRPRPQPPTGVARRCFVLAPSWPDAPVCPVSARAAVVAQPTGPQCSLCCASSCHSRSRRSACCCCPANGVITFTDKLIILELGRQAVLPAKPFGQRCRKPEAPDWLGDMSPYWQTLEQSFGAHFDATIKESKSHYTEFWHPVRSPVLLSPDMPCSVLPQPCLEQQWLTVLLSCPLRDACARSSVPFTLAGVSTWRPRAHDSTVAHLHSYAMASLRLLVVIHAQLRLRHV